MFTVINRSIRSIAKRVLEQASPSLLLRLRASRGRAGADSEEIAFILDFDFPSGPRAPDGQDLKGLGKIKTVAIDVGANVGIYSNFLAQRFDHVLSVEPIDQNVALLRKSLPSNCRICPTVLGAEESVVDIHIPVIDGRQNTALSSVRAENLFLEEKAEGRDVLSVPQTTGDRLVAERLKAFGDAFRICFVKIDVEGYELQVLAGFDGVIALHRPILLIEIEKRHNPEFERIFELLGQAGYAPYILEDGEMKPTSSEAVESAYQMLTARGQTGLVNPHDLEGAGDRYTNNFVFLPEKGN